VADDHHLLSASTASPISRRPSTSSTASARSPRSEGHHPDLELAWGRVGVKIFTHKIDGLTESDFVLAAKIEEESQKESQKAEGRRQK
jgi:4a-hydroxytetrahydrobiopterin dehydratase